MLPHPPQLALLPPRSALALGCVGAPSMTERLRVLLRLSPQQLSQISDPVRSGLPFQACHCMFSFDGTSHLCCLLRHPFGFTSDASSRTHPRLFLVVGSMLFLCGMMKPRFHEFFVPFSTNSSDQSEKAPQPSRFYPFGLTQQKRQFLNFLNCPGAPASPL